MTAPRTSRAAPIRTVFRKGSCKKYDRWEVTMQTGEVHCLRYDPRITTKPRRTAKGTR